jgi:hypothetical protein
MADKATRIGARKGPRSEKSKGNMVSIGKIEGHDAYMAEDDARTIARAHAIKADPDRAKRAGLAAHKMAEEKAAELRGLRGIARRAH